MKLGIIVVYLVSPENEQLFDIHLKQIKKNTVSDYVIYANINMLSNNVLLKFNKPNIKTIKNLNYIGPNEGLRSTFELSHYAEPLIEYAIRDGMTHIVMMHPDSFPVKEGWDQILARQLTSKTVLISIFPAMSASMFFHKKFYLKYHPRLLPSSKDIKTPSYKEFVKSINAENLLEPGMGYAYEIYKRKLKWEILARSNKGEDHYHFGSIFKDLVFHLGASEHKDRSFTNYQEQNFIPSIKRTFGKILSPIIKEKIKTSKLQEFLRPEIKMHQYYHSTVKESLYIDPEGYIEFLRRGLKN